MIYIISNRKVLTKNGQEVFNDNGKENALPVFRIAEGQLNHDKKKVDYRILKDDFPLDYENVVSVLDMEPGNKNKAEENLKGTGEMFYHLYNKMLASKDKRSDVLCFIHGYANSFQDNLKHIYKLHKRYVVPADSPIEHIVYFSWPTRNHKVLTYWNDQRDAQETGKVLARVYEKLQGFFFQMFEVFEKERCRNKIHLAAHSMGAQVLEHMLEAVPDRKLYPLLGEVLLLHADVRNDVFEEGKPFSKLEKISERAHAYIHNSDDALFLSTVSKNFNKRLGRRGPSKKTELSKETVIVDLTASRGAESFREEIFDHWGYLDRGVERKDIITVLNGVDERLIANRTQHRLDDNVFYLS